MSLDLISWALRQPVPKSSAKFVLVALANQARNEGCFSFPSVAYLAEATSQDRKTVIANLGRLIEWGLIEDTGERVGRTGQVVIYRLLADPSLFDTSPKTELFRNRNRTGNGTVPKRHVNGPAFPREQSRKRDTEPEGNRKEPEKQEKRASAPSLPKPHGVEDGTWADWLALRKAKRAPVTQTVVNHATAEAAKAGLTLESFLRVWCGRGSQGLEADWLKPNERGPQQAREGKQMQGLRALEELKNAARNRQRLAAGGDCDGAAEALDALPGPDPRR